MWDETRDLGVWHDSLEAGADNNPAVLDHPPCTVVGADLNAFLYRDYRALSHVARELGERDDADDFAGRAEHIRTAMNRHLWSEEDVTFYNLDAASGKLIRRHVCTNYYPLWAGLAPRERGEACIRKYFLDPAGLWGKHGMRSLSAADPDYNNRNIIKPYSNFRGPVWPIINYLYLHGLLHYGFQQQALELAARVAGLVLADIRATGSTHENYDAETGQPLAAPGFVGWNILVDNMLGEVLNNYNPFALREAE
jgi:alpha,alpha-trehalase